MNTMQQQLASAASFYLSRMAIDENIRGEIGQRSGQSHVVGP